MPPLNSSGCLTDIAGIRVGHYTDNDAATGCTVILCPPGTVGGIDVRGGAPGTRETDLLRPTNLVQEVNAILLTGGSAFGLDAATGVVRYLEGMGIGFDVGVARVPIVPAAVLFDLGVGSSKVRPDAVAGYRACQLANDGPVPEGSVGAGTGATVGKLLGPSGASKGGIGTASLRLADGTTVGAIVAVNAIGDVVDPDTGHILAGARSPTGEFVDALSHLLSSTFGESPDWAASLGANTTIGVVATNARLSKEDVNRLAQMAQDGLAQAIRPAHTIYDGDTLFALATGQHTPAASLTRLGAAAAYVVAQSIVRAVLVAAQ